MTEELVFRIDRLDRLMEKRGLGPGELAYLSGVSYDMIYALRKGRRANVSVILAMQLAKALNTTVEWLVDVPASEDPADDPEQAKRQVQVVRDARAEYVTDNPMATVLLEVFDHLSAWRQRELVYIARGMTAAQEDEMTEGDGEDHVAAMAALFEYVEHAYGMEVANRLEEAMSQLLTADETTLLALAEYLETLELQHGDGNPAM